MLSLIVTLGVAFVVCLWIGDTIESEKFNTWYNEKCVKTVESIPERQLKQLKSWVEEHIEGSTSIEMTYLEILNSMPANLRHRISEKKMRGLMYSCGYEPLGNCFLDPSKFAVHLINLDADSTI